MVERGAPDLVLLLARGEKPHYAAGLSPEGKPFGDLFDAARKSAATGVPRSLLAQGRPPARVALRVLALRLPASVTPPAGEPTTAGTAAASVPPLRLAGDWSGNEIESGERKFVTASFAPPAGTLTYQRALTITVPLTSVEQGRDGSVRFEAQAGRGTRYYSGKWEGQKIAGKISSDTAGCNVKGGWVKNEKAQAVYAEVNLQKLSTEMAHQRSGPSGHRQCKALLRGDSAVSCGRETSHPGQIRECLRATA